MKCVFYNVIDYQINMPYQVWWCFLVGKTKFGRAEPTTKDPSTTIGRVVVGLFFIKSEVGKWLRMFNGLD